MITNRSAPEAAVVPVLIYDDVEQAVDFLCGAFGFVERLRAAGRDGRVSHAQLATAGGGAIMLGRRGGPFRPPEGGVVSQYVHVTVDDADRHFQRAKEFGARIVASPADMPFGERQYTAEDVGSHWWTFSQHVADVAPEEWGATEAAPQLRPKTGAA
jgi:uncharacterized glyoxalase superfamily protein PhnB